MLFSYFIFGMQDSWSYTVWLKLIDILEEYNNQVTDPVL